MKTEFAAFKGSFPKRKGFQSMLRHGKYSFYGLLCICNMLNWKVLNASDLRLIKEFKLNLIAYVARAKRTEA